MSLSSRRISIGILSLGCSKTLVDSEVILGMLNSKRFRIASHVTDCDIAIINTCAFIHDAKQESIDQILSLIQLKREGKIKGILVAGCLPQRYPKELQKEFEDVDAFLGTSEYELIGRVIENILQGKKISHISKDPGFIYSSSMKRVSLTPVFTRYIKISEGCDRGCSFCTIPDYRGGYRSRPTDDILKEANQLVEDGARELVITGQDTTFYGFDLKKKFLLPKLLRELDQIKKIKWLRLLYTYPLAVSEDLIQTIKSGSKICHYLDMPLQHINSRILKQMKRGMTKEIIRKLLKRLRTEIPDLAIRTTFIVGFPGETEAEFEELLDLMREFQFDRLGVFAYSQEEGTPAAKLAGQISEKIKARRLHEAMALQQAISIENNKRLIGKTVEVLIEGKAEKEKGVFVGRTYMDAPEVDGLAYIRMNPKNLPKIKPGDFIEAKIIDSKEYDLIGNFVKMSL